jgi:A/G-specific adenine glycosylase
MVDNFGMVEFDREQFEEKLLIWYARHGRKLPWRETKDPYKIWISEIMLQQTQVERVKGFYKRFIERFPTVQSLARASWEELLEYWRGLGYYRRARSLHKTAQILVDEFEGKFPFWLKKNADLDKQLLSLKKLPGIGDYTAAAIASFVFGAPVAALDTNIKRVFKQLLGARFDHLQPAGQFTLASSLVAKNSADLNQALMDLGATICLSGSPKCGICPLKNMCLFHLSGLYQESEKPSFFFKRSAQALADKPSHSYGSKKMMIKVAAGIIIQDGKILITQRRKDTTFPHYWEFPGGKLEAGEDERTCLKREIMEELGIEVAVRSPLYTTKTKHKNSTIQLSFHRCSILLGRPQAKEVAQFLWVKPEELSSYQFPPANKEVIALLQRKKAIFWN